MMRSNRFCHFGGWSDHEGASGDGADPGGGERSSGSGEGAPPSGGDRSGRSGVRPVTAADREDWTELFTGYCDFYERPSTAEQRDQVWSWIEAGTIHCLLAVPAGQEGGAAVGLAHVRPCPSPLRGELVGYLDDLFIAPDARGSGVFEDLMAGIRDLARAEGWSVVRWITAIDNSRAQSAYDRLSTRTEWVTYQLDV